MNRDLPIDRQYIDDYETDEEREYKAFLEDMRIDMEVDAYMERELEESENNY